MKVKIADDSVERFLMSLEKKILAKTLRMIDLLEVFGRDLAMPHAKAIKGGVFELRIRGKQEVRLFYVFHKNGAVVVHGFIKKGQKIPPRELRIAQKKRLTLI